MYPIEMLDKAEQFVAISDDIFLFQDQYSTYREFFSIKESVTRALISLNLYDKFLKFYNLEHRVID